MRVLSRKPFRDAATRYPNDAAAIDRTYKVLCNGTFKRPDDLRKVFPSLDNFTHKDKWWVIDIGGNNLRLIAFINFKDNRLYVRTMPNMTGFPDNTKGGNHGKINLNRYSIPYSRVQ